MSDKSLLDKTKTVLKSLIVSSQEDLTVDRLNFDYKEREGREIPFSLLGFRNLKDFLYSMPDVLSLNSRTNIVTLVVSEDSNSAVSMHLI